MGTIGLPVRFARCAAHFSAYPLGASSPVPIAVEVGTLGVHFRFASRQAASRSLWPDVRRGYFRLGEDQASTLASMSG